MCNAMEYNNDRIMLDECDSEDISDVLLRIEKSFGLTFANDSFKDVKTFGELCDIILSNVHYKKTNDCTTQQAYYKVRNAILDTQLIDKDQINLDSQLHLLFPRNNRRKRVMTFQKALGVPLDILDIKNWLGWSIFILYLISLGLFFINWQQALTGLIFTSIAYWIALKFKKELKFKTVRELVKVFATEHYIRARRDSNSYNEEEAINTIKQLFINHLDLDYSTLTKDTRFGWTN